MSKGLFAIGVNQVSEMRKILEDVSFCKQTLSEEMPNFCYRAVIRYKNVEDLSSKCHMLVQQLGYGQDFHDYIDAKEGVFLIKQKASSKRQIAFVYPGQGTQHNRMLGQYLTNPTFSKNFEAMMSFLPAQYRQVYEGPDELIHRTDFTQPLLASVEWSLTCWLKELGVAPEYSIGHSFGELTALASAGCYESRELMELALERGKIMHQASLSGEGAMIAVIDPKSTSWKEIDAILKKEKFDLELANINSDQQLVYSGLKESILKLKKVCESKGYKSTLLQTSAAFHSRYMGDSGKNFYKVLSGKSSSYKEPEHYVFSNYECRPYKSIDHIPDHLSNQIISKVEWLQVMKKTYKAGARVFIEVGPKRTLTRLLEKTLPSGDCRYIALDSSGDWVNMSLYLWTLGLTERGPDFIFQRNENVFTQNIQDEVISSFLKAQEALIAHAESLDDILQRKQAKAKIIQDAQEVLKVYFSTQDQQVYSTDKNENSPVEFKTGASAKQADRECPILMFLKKEVSELTGFEINEISDDADFDNDLALDSITKMDFFSSVVEKMGARAPETNELVSLRTLKEVADYLNAQKTQDLPLEQDVDTEKALEKDRAKLKRKETRSFESALCESIQSFRGLSRNEISTNSHLEKDLGLNVFEREEIFNALWSSYPYMQIAGRSILNVETVGELVELEKALDRRKSVRMEEPVKRYEWIKVPLKRNPLAIGKFQSPVLFLPFFATNDLTQIQDYLSTQTRVHRYDLSKKEGLTSLDEVAVRVASEKGLDILFLVSPLLRIDEYGEESLDNHLEMIYKLSQKLIEVQKKVSNIELKILMNSCNDVFFKGLVGLFRSLSREIDIRVTIVDLAWEKIPASLIPWDILWTGKDIKTRCEYVREEEGTFYHEQLNSLYDDKGPDEENKLSFEKGEPVLVLGGARGICAEVSKYLASEYQVHIVAIGRTDIGRGNEKSKEVKNTEHSIVERGGLFTYISVDACNFSEFKKVLDEFHSKYGPFKAVVHGVGTTDDALLKDKDYKRFSHVIKTKVLSAINTFRYFKQSQDLRLVSFFSSLSSWTGAPGQTDYSFANEVLNELAQEWGQNRSDLPVCSMLWSVWGESGLASKRLLTQMKKLNLGTITNKEGIRLFRNELERYGLRSTKVLFTPLSTLKYSEQAGSGESDG